MTEMEARGIPSPYAVLCDHGALDNPQRCYLTRQEYDYQIRRPDSLWKCPICKREASWDDLNHEEWMEKEERLEGLDVGFEEKPQLSPANPDVTMVTVYPPSSETEKAVDGGDLVFLRDCIDRDFLFLPDQERADSIIDAIARSMFSTGIEELAVDANRQSPTKAGRNLDSDI